MIWLFISFLTFPAKDFANSFLIITFVLTSIFHNINNQLIFGSCPRVFYSFLSPVQNVIGCPVSYDYKSFPCLCEELDNFLLISNLADLLREI